MNYLDSVDPEADEPDAEVLSYRAFRDREILRAWRERLQLHERAAAREATRPAAHRAWRPGFAGHVQPGH